MKREQNWVCQATSANKLFHEVGHVLILKDEFQASSKELEDELERELAATEKQQADLREKIKRLEGEKEDWKVS
jgi:chaperonin cofactor prefoldin